MRFLLDANLSRRPVARFTTAGYEMVHVGDVGLLTALDSAIFDHAAAEGYVVITADTDFSMLLAARRAARPSVVLLRHVAELRPDAHAELLAANLPAVMDELQRGAVVSLGPHGCRSAGCRSHPAVRARPPSPTWTDGVVGPFVLRPSA